MGNNSVSMLHLDYVSLQADLSSRDGDLSATQSLPANPFFLFSLESSHANSLELSQTLDLGVGEKGIIGRRVSVMTGSKRGPKTVAEGIIGWN